jgi:uncharacterized protein with FMN-binding domain
MKRRKKGKLIMIILFIVVVILLAMGGAMLFTAGERKEGKNLPIETIDFKNLNDGTYIGTYEGGKYKWRANEVQVTISSGKVTDIMILKDKIKNSPYTDGIYDKIIKDQTLQVDTVSGATITSKAYLKAVEDALMKAR